MEAKGTSDMYTALNSIPRSLGTVNEELTILMNPEHKKKRKNGRDSKNCRPAKHASSKPSMNARRYRQDRFFPSKLGEEFDEESIGWTVRDGRVQRTIPVTISSSNPYR